MPWCRALQKTLRRRARRSLHIAQLALDGAGAHAHLVKLLGGGVDGFLVASTTSPNLANSVLTTPSRLHTLGRTLFNRQVLKPICRLLSMAARLAGR